MLEELMSQAFWIGLAKIIGTKERPVADPREQVSLCRFKHDESAKHIEQVEEIGCVLRKPAIGLNLVERRRRAPVADDRFRAVTLSVAEPVPKNLLA